MKKPHSTIARSEVKLNHEKLSVHNDLEEFLELMTDIKYKSSADHFTHCFKAPYSNSCKWDDNSCPQKKKQDLKNNMNKAFSKNNP